ncbi:hypothetical protein ALC60_09637 [Trachymyrmex zeteki]|uniref:CCHC-type domain-containing protein n=1 Tax=Mycetomoellerius zeteki TaxID=64791 RepID=A0A151WTV4_9HYME|nr:hypothetical protein ALC60_09637 [Trachymyrmex zeteki]
MLQNANANDNTNVTVADSGHPNITYDKGDRSPFVVFVRRIADGSNNDVRLDPISVARIVSRFADGKILEVKSAGRNKVAVHFGDYAIANRALSHPSIKEAGLTASIPSFNILRTGVIRNVPLDISENDVVNLFSSQFKILSAKRLNIRTRKDGELITSPSRTVLIKFRGQNLPRAVTFLHVNFPVYPYIPRVLMCFSCLRYGHVNADCKSKARCARCGNKKHATPDECPRLRLPPHCCNCGGEHLPSSSVCPSYLRHKHIYATAALENILYAEARLKLDAPSLSPSSSPPPNIFHLSDFPTLSHSST